MKAKIERLARVHLVLALAGHFWPKRILLEMALCPVWSRRPHTYYH